MRMCIVIQESYNNIIIIVVVVDVVVIITDHPRVEQPVRRGFRFQSFAHHRPFSRLLFRRNFFSVVPIMKYVQHIAICSR